MYEVISVQDPLLDTTNIENRPALIAAATTRLRERLIHAQFGVDDEGRPYSPDVRERLRQAAAAQIVAWDRWGVIPGGPVANPDRVKSSVKLGTATVTFADADHHSKVIDQLQTSLDPSAEVWLRPLLGQPHY